MKRETVFIDVGGHQGETLEEVVKPVWRFDRIICFEPQAELAEYLRRNFMSKRVRIISAALSDADGKTEIFGDGAGASLFRSKFDIDPGLKQTIATISASDFFRDNIGDDAMVMMKLNCEGGEGAVLRDLAASGEIHKIHSVMIDFDLRKVPGMKQEPCRILQLLAGKNFKNYFLAEYTHTGISVASNVRNWLAHVPDIEQFCRESDTIVKNRQTPSIRRRIRIFRRYHPAWSLPRILHDTCTKPR